MLNDRAPEFELESSTGQFITLSDLHGTFVVLIFYPMNDTPICNRQLSEMSINTKELLQYNARVFGINTASRDKHSQYCIRKRLDFPILSDPGGAIAKKYKAWMNWLPIPKRTVVVIDPDGIICFYKRGAPSPVEVIQAIHNRADLTKSV